MVKTTVSEVHCPGLQRRQSQRPIISDFKAVLPQTGHAHLDGLTIGLSFAPQLGHGAVKTLPVSVIIKTGMLTISLQCLQHAARKEKVKFGEGVWFS